MRRRCRGLERAVAVERLHRRQDLRTFAGSGAVGCLRLATGRSPNSAARPSVEIRRSISTNSADIGRFDHSEIGYGVERHDLALAARRGGDKRRSVLQSRPHVHAGADHGWVGEDLADDCHFLRHGQTGRKARRLERRQRFGVDHDSAPPRERPPIRSGTGNSVVAALLQARTREAASTPPLRPRACTCSFTFAGQRADVGEHQDRRRFVSARHRYRRGWASSARELGETAPAPSRCSRAAPAAAVPAPGFLPKADRSDAIGSGHRAGRPRRPNALRQLQCGWT